MTYCDGGDLAKGLRAVPTGRKFSEDQILNWFVQISLGLRAMHQNNILLRDLRPKIFFSLGMAPCAWRPWNIKGTRRHNGHGQDMWDPLLHESRLFRNEPYNNKSDIWAMGCILYELYP